MPSPFPGMDPYLENPVIWPDFHLTLLSEIHEQLNAVLRPSKVARVKLRTFVVEDDDPASDFYVVPNGRLTRRRHLEHLDSLPIAANFTPTPAKLIDVTDSVETVVARERFLEIREVATGEVITVVELVSPANKPRGSAGRAAFQKSRHLAVESNQNWLEIDLLREGSPTFGADVPRLAYHAYVDRAENEERRRQFVWPIALRERLPVLPVPLRPGESEVSIDLQAALDSAYFRASYDADTDYRRPPDPPLGGDDEAWADALLRSKGFRR